MSKKSLTPANHNAAEETHVLPLLPLKDIVVFPHMIVPVFINEELCINAVESALSGNRKIFLSAFKNPSDKEGDLKASLEPPFDVYDVGTVCTIMRTRKLSDGRIKVLVQGVNKAEVVGLDSSTGYPAVRVRKIDDMDLDAETAAVEAIVRSVRENLEKVVGLGKVLSPDIVMILEDVNEPGRLSDLIAANLGLKVHEAQSILALNSSIARLNKVHGFLAREIEVYQMQMQIQNQAKNEINRMQREHYLREQIRAIKTELGETEKDDTEGFWTQIEDKPMPTETKEEISRQIRRLERMHQDTSEASLTRTYIETVLSLPWGVKTTENLSMKNVQKVLDEDHYGLEDIKDRIIEFLAVKKLNKTAKSPIICFVGPPGVGKTSLGRSIARSMNREFERISLGGVKDEADIRGHRRTYVGAFPGRIVQAVKNCKSSNPIIMLDEIDKLTSDHRGDPSSALLEVLDPEQNKDFKDHYLGVPFDLSDVMFIANANTLSTIPAPLLDRMEVIELSGYAEEEKVIIANQYLIPKQIKESGLAEAGVSFSRTAVTTLINNYTQESGLRGLEKQIASVCRKLARGHAETQETEGKELPKDYKQTPATIQKHLRSKKYGHDFYHLEPTPGVALGLAYTTYGGKVLAIEANLIPSSKAGLVLTGQLGDVMKESAQAAFSYVKSRAESLGIARKRIEENEIHIHIPAGATPKDGPSAGVALASAMISAFTNIAPRPLTAMTGEITLLGKVLPIGGVKEKILAAIRQTMTLVILPEENRGSWDDLPQNAKKGIECHFVSHYDEVFDILFSAEEGVTHIRGGVRAPKDTDLAS